MTKPTLLALGLILGGFAHGQNISPAIADEMLANYVLPCIDGAAIQTGIPIPEQQKQVLVAGLKAIVELTWSQVDGTQYAQALETREGRMRWYAGMLPDCTATLVRRLEKSAAPAPI